MPYNPPHTHTQGEDEYPIHGLQRMTADVHSNFALVRHTHAHHRQHTHIHTWRESE